MHLLIFCVLIFSIVGFGPALYLVSFRSSRHLYDAFLLSPVIGLGVCAVVIVNLVYAFDITLDDYSTLILIALIATSLILSLTFLLPRRRDARRLVFSWTTLLILVTGVLVGGALLLSGEIGGQGYRLWKANIYDWSNYNLMSFYRIHFDKTTFTSPAMFREVANVFPELFNIGRPGVSYVMGWLATLSDTPIYTMSHYYILALVFTLFPTGVAIGRLLRFRLKYSLTLAIVLTVSFFTYAIVDISALSHVSTLSISIFFLYAWIELERRQPDAWISQERILLAISIAFIFILYPELLPLLIAAMIAYYGLRWLDFPTTNMIYRAAKHSTTGIIALILAAPTVSESVRFLQSQTSFGATADVQWQHGLFPWMYANDNLITNLWGMNWYWSPLAPDGLVARVIILGTLLVSIVLITILIRGFLAVLSAPAKQPSATILFSLVSAYWGAGLTLHLWALQWTGGKALLMGGLFVVIALFIFARDTLATMNSYSGKSLIAQYSRYVVALVVVGWVLSQIFLPFLRAYAVSRGWGFREYPPIYTDAHEVIAPAAEQIEQVDAPIVYSYLADMPDPREGYWTLLLTQLSQLHIAIRGGYYLNPTPLENWQRDDHIPDFLVFDQNTDLLENMGTLPLITPPENFIRLYRIASPTDLDFTNGMINFNGLDVQYQPITTNIDQPFIENLDTDELVRWMVEDWSRIRFLASGENDYALYWRGIPAYTGTMQVELLDDQQILSEQATITGEVTENLVCFRPTPGTNDIMFSHTAPEEPENNGYFLTENLVVFPMINQIDIGSADQLYVIAGWEAHEQWGDENVRWANQDASVQLVTCNNTEGGTLRFRAFLNDDLNDVIQTVNVELNGETQATITLESGWQEYEVPLKQADFLPDTLQEITLSHAWAVIPQGEVRELAVAYDWFRFEGESPD